MRLSVILPCFNGADTIAVQLDALERQHWPDGWEVVVVNNGSTDPSMSIVEGYQGRLPGLRIVQAHTPGTPRLGVPHSYNVGMAAAQGDAFVFCEADDEVAPGWLQAMGEALQQHAFVAARMDHRKLNPAWLHPTEGEGYQSSGLSTVKGSLWLPYASGCTFGMRREVFEKVGLLSTAFPCVHDTEFSWRAQLAGYRLHFEPRAVVHYRERTEPSARFRQGRNWGRDFTRLLHRHGAHPGRLPVVRQLLRLTRFVPQGALVVIWLWLDACKGRALLALWVWSLGWEMGKLQALRQDPPAGAEPQPGDRGAVGA